MKKLINSIAFDNLVSKLMYEDTLTDKEQKKLDLLSKKLGISVDDSIKDRTKDTNPVRG